MLSIQIECFIDIHVFGTEWKSMRLWPQTFHCWNGADDVFYFLRSLLIFSMMDAYRRHSFIPVGHNLLYTLILCSRKKLYLCAGNSPSACKQMGSGLCGWQMQFCPSHSQFLVGGFSLQSFGYVASQVNLNDLCYMLRACLLSRSGYEWDIFIFPVLYSRRC